MTQPVLGFCTKYHQRTFCIGADHWQNLFQVLVTTVEAVLGRDAQRLLRSGSARGQPLPTRPQEASARMVADASGMVRQLRLFNES